LHEDLFSPWRKNVFITVEIHFHHGEKMNYSQS